MLRLWNVCGCVWSSPIVAGSLIDAARPRELIAQCTNVSLREWSIWRRVPRFESLERHLVVRNSSIPTASPRVYRVLCNDCKQEVRRKWSGVEKNKALQEHLALCPRYIAEYRTTFVCTASRSEGIHLGVPISPWLLGPTPLQTHSNRRCSVW